MKKQIQIIVELHSTKTDIYGNRYFVAIITNAKTDQSFTCNANSRGNIECILKEAGYDWNRLHVTEICTGSARTSSLPDNNCIYLNECRINAKWKKALNNIGLRVKRA